MKFGLGLGFQKNTEVKKNRYYCAFDGAGDYIDAGFNNVGKFGTSEFSIALWFRSNNMVATQNGIISYGNYNTAGGWCIDFHGNGLLRFFFDAAIRGQYSGYNNDEWHLLIFQRDGIWLDDDKKTSLSLNDDINAIQNLYVGRRSDTKYFSGFEDNVTIYNRKLTDKEKTILWGGRTPKKAGDPMQLSGTELCYKFEKSGADAYDYSGNGNTGIAYGDTQKVRY